MTLNSLGQDMHLMTGDMVTPVLFGVSDLGELEDWYWGARGEAMTQALVESMACTVEEWRRLKYAINQRDLLQTNGLYRAVPQ